MSKPREAEPTTIPDKFSFTVNEFGAAIGAGRSKTFELIRTGKLRAVKLGSRTIILKEDALEFLHSLPPVPVRNTTSGAAPSTAANALVAAITEFFAEPRNRKRLDELLSELVRSGIPPLSRTAIIDFARSAGIPREAAAFMAQTMAPHLKVEGHQCQR